MRWPGKTISIIREQVDDSAAALSTINRQLDGVALMRATLPLTPGTAPILYAPAMAEEGGDRFRRTWDAYVDGVGEGDPTLIALSAAVATGAGQGTLLSTGFNVLAPDYMRWSRAMSGTDWITDWRRDGNVVQVFAMHRPIASFDPGEAPTLRLLAGYLLLTERMANEQTVAAAQASADAVFLLDARLTLRHANVAADRLLGLDDGLRLVAGRMECADRATDAALVRAMTTAVAGGGSPEPSMLVMPALRTARRYLVWVSPVRFAGPGGSAIWGVQLRIVDTAAPLATLALDQIAALFGLTPAERSVAAALMVAGQPVPMIADMCGIAYNTARTHVAQLRAKTGTTSLAELVRLLSRFA